MTTLVACALTNAASAAVAGVPTAVNVRIEGRTQALFEGPILTEGHAVSSFRGDGGSEVEDLAEHSCDGINELDPGNTGPGPTPTAAGTDATEEIGEAQTMGGQWYPGFDDYFVKQWGAEAENAEADGRSWGVLVNNVFTNVGGCQYELSTGDEVLWSYNAFEFRPFLALFATGASYTGGERPLTATASLGKPFEVEVLAYEDDGEDNPPAEPERAGASPLAGAVVAPVITSAKGFEKVEMESPAAIATDAEGKASVTFTSPGWHRLIAGAPVNAETGEEEAIRSNRLDVCVPPEGASGCGQLPGDDRLRVPPRYRAAIGPEPENWSAPRIDGQAATGQTLTVDEGLWTGTEPINYTFRWQRCDNSRSGCEDIPGATAPAYEITAGDEGHMLRAVVTAGNGAGSAERESPPTSEVPIPPSPGPGPGSPPAMIGPGPKPAPMPGGQTLPATSSRLPPRVTVAGLGARKLVLMVSATGRISVRIWRRSRYAGGPMWRALKTLMVGASRAGRITVKLPLLSPGSYRLGISLSSSKTVYRMLTVHRR